MSWKTAEAEGDADERISRQEMLGSCPHQRHSSTQGGAAVCADQQPMELGEKQCPHRSREGQRNQPRSGHTHASGEYGSALTLPGCWCSHRGPRADDHPLTARTCPQCPEGECQGSSSAGIMQGLCEGLPHRDGPSTAVMPGEHPALHGPLASLEASSPCGPQPSYHHWIPTVPDS